MSDAIDQTAMRLLGLLPAHVGLADAAQGGALLALLRSLASGRVEIDAEIDRLLDGSFVETAGPAGLAALARLVGAPPLAPLPGEANGADRAFIANTVRRRRAKGTARALEGVAGDVTGAGAVVVEYFTRLARLAHLADVRPERPALASLVDGDIRARLGTAFDRTPRLADIRSIARAGGRHGIGAVGVHVARLVAPQFPAPAGAVVSADRIAGVPQLTPWLDAGVPVPGYFQLAARPGGIQPLVNPDRRPAAGRMDEVGVVARLRRLPLHRETERLRLSAARGSGLRADAPRPWFDDDGQPFALFLRRAGAAVFDRVPPAQLAIVNLATMPSAVAGVHPRPAALRPYEWREAGPLDPTPGNADLPIAAAMDPATGRVVIADPGIGADVVEVRLAHAFGLQAALGAGPQERNDSTVPFAVASADFLRVVDPSAPIPGPEHAATLEDALADWDAAAGVARGFIVLARCDVAAAAAAPTVRVKPGCELHILAAQWRPKRLVPGVPDQADRRGYLVRVGRRATLPLGLTIADAGGGPRPGALVLDGLSLAGPLAIAPDAASVLRIRHCTLRPVNGPAIVTAAPFSAVSLVIEHCIAHALALETVAGAGNGALSVRDCIVTADGAADGAAVAAIGLDASLCNATVLGDARVKTLEATNLIVTGAIIARRRQAGCARFSFLGPGSRPPRQFRCQPDLAVAERGAALAPMEAAAVRLGAAPVFLDTDLDEPTAAMLHARCPDGIRRGGEGGTEMGAFAASGQPIRHANLAALFDEDLPVALEAAILDGTRSRAANDRRTVP